MHHVPFLVLVILSSIGTAASMLVPTANGVVTMQKSHVEDVRQTENGDGAQTSLGETTRNGVERIFHGVDSAPMKSIPNGRPAFIVADGSHGDDAASHGDDAAYPISEVLKGHPKFIIVGGSPENVNDRVDNVEARVESVADELHSFETLAGIYFFIRLFGGFLFSSVIL